MSGIRALGVLPPLRAHVPLADVRAPWIGAGKFRHDRLPAAGLTSWAAGSAAAQPSDRPFAGVSMVADRWQVADLLLQGVDLALLVRGGAAAGAGCACGNWAEPALAWRRPARRPWCRPLTSLFRMRMDWPSDRPRPAASWPRTAR